MEGQIKLKSSPELSFKMTHPVLRLYKGFGFTNELKKGDSVAIRCGIIECEQVEHKDTDAGFYVELKR